MSKNSLTDRVTRLFFSFLFNSFVKEIDSRLRDYVLDISKIVIRVLVLAIVGMDLILVGVLFLCMAMVNYISTYLPSWLAWLGAGFVIFFVGFVISILSLERKR